MLDIESAAFVALRMIIGRAAMQIQEDAGSGRGELGELWRNQCKVHPLLLTIPKTVKPGRQRQIISQSVSHWQSPPITSRTTGIVTRKGLLPATFWILLLPNLLTHFHEDCDQGYRKSSGAYISSCSILTTVLQGSRDSRVGDICIATCKVRKFVSSPTSIPHTTYNQYLPATQHMNEFPCC